MDSQIFDRAKAMKSLLNQASPSLCLAKWYQVTLFLQNGYSSSCHHVRAHKISKRAIKIDPSALHNTEYKKWMRRLMKKGRFPKECRYCWNIEKLGKLSDRHYKSSEDWANPKFNRVVDSAWNQNVNPTNLEVVFGNHCNFKCSYCNPISSSRWQKEQRESGDFAVATNPYKAWKRKLKGNYIYDTEELNPYVEAFWQWWPDLVNSLKVFRITGGEPLLNPNTWRVIDYFIENPRPDLVFEINSNLGVSSVLVNKLVDKVNQLSGKVRFFNLYTSVDNVGARAEYIRNGLDYKLYCRNVEHYLAHTKGNVALSYMITMNLLCLGGQKKLFAKIFDQKHRYPDQQINIDTPYLKSPEYLSLQLLPRDNRKALDESLEFVKSTLNDPLGFKAHEYERLARVRDWMSDSSLNPWDRDLFMRDFAIFVDEHDRRRGTDFCSTFSELLEFYQACQALGPHSRFRNIGLKFYKIYQTLLKPFSF